MNILIESINDILKHNCCMYPSPFPYLKESFYLESEAEDLAKERYDAQVIYSKFVNFLGLNMSKDERYILNLYRTYGQQALSRCYKQQNNIISFIPKLKANNYQIVQSSKYGKIVYEFNSHAELNVSNSLIMAYDNETYIIHLFVEDKEKIKLIEIIDFIRYKRRFIHELTHFIDDKLKQSKNLNYDFNNPKEYINDPDEFKAISQQLVVAVGTYIKKYWKQINFDRLNDLNYIGDLLEDILGKNTRYYFKNKDDIDFYNAQINYMSDKNKKVLYTYIRDYLKDIYNTEKDIDLLKLFDPEEYLKEHDIDGNI